MDEREYSVILAKILDLDSVEMGDAVPVKRKDSSRPVDSWHLKSRRVSVYRKALIEVCSLAKACLY